MGRQYPLHEWTYLLADRPQEITDTAGIRGKDREESTPNLTTWVFEEGTFHPAAKITEDNAYSIITDYLGTPVEMYGQDGKKTWQARLDIYGKVANFEGRALSDCPFRYQGQYEDEETGLYYNRFRYYSPDEGMYISQDPIKFISNTTNFYQYVNNSNLWIDEFGLYSDLLDTGMGHHLMPRSIAKNLNIPELMENNSIAWYPNIGENTADLHKLLHRDLIDEGIPFHGSKYTGSVDEFFEKAAKAYKDIDVKGYLKIPVTDNKILKDVTPAEALEKLKDLYKKGAIPCK